MQVLFLGMLGEFSTIPLQKLLEAGVNVCGVIIPSRRDEPRASKDIIPLRPLKAVSELPVINQYLAKNIIHIAWEHDIPVFEIANPGGGDTLKVIQSLNPDVSMVACFSKIIPHALLSLPPFGFLNLHPSLLPAFRGPEPLFWIFRQGEQNTGVTLHFVDEGIDTGEIALQVPLNLPDGMSGQEASRKCALIGAELMMKAIQLLDSGELSRFPQTGEGSYYPFPSAADFRIPLGWTARHAFNFIKGTAEWEQPYLVEVEGRVLRIKTAVSYDDKVTMKRPFISDDGGIWIQFNQGVLHARLW